MPLIIPNTIENDTAADAAEIQQNYSTIQTYTNSSLIHRDGSVAMTQPLTLVGDPTQPNHAANKAYVDAVETHADLLDTTKVAKAGDTMTGPLIVEQARVGTRTDGTLDALFSHKDANPADAVGLICAADGSTGLVQAAGKTFALWNRKASGAGHDLRASFGPTASAFFQHVAIDEAGNQCLALHSTAGGQPYIGFYHGGVRYGYIQQTSLQMRIAQDGNTPIDFYTGNIHRLRVGAGVSTSFQLQTTFNSPTNLWPDSPLFLYVSGGGAPRITFHWPGFAPQFRGGYGWNQFECRNQDDNAYVGIIANGFTVSSALDTKRDVRPLRNRKIEVRKLKTTTDTVDVPDVMALRPIVFRPKVEPTRINYKDKECKEPDGSVPEPTTTVNGREGRRERLGLIADEVQHILPCAVIHDPNDSKPVGIDYAQITVALLDHVQQLTDKVAELEAKLS